MGTLRLTSFILVVLLFTLTILSHSQVHAATLDSEPRIKRSLESPFSSALDTLQQQIGYTFKSISLLRRAMTHASFSEENNKALSVLGTHLIETTFSFLSLKNDIDISAKDLNRQITDISKVESSCSVDGKRLGLQKIVRVAPKVNASAPAVICDAFRAIFGAIAIDTGKPDDAGNFFWKVHRGEVGGALSL